MSEEKNTTESPVTTSALSVSLSSGDLESLAKEFKSSAATISGLIELLDQGNAIPFIARFRRDEIGGLNETQIREIKKSVSRLRVLSERRLFVLKAIDSQGQLSDQISQQVQAAQTARELESIYHPFKTKKVSRATTARQQGLEPLAEEILNADSNDIDIATRATNFVRVDRGLNSVDDVIHGVCDLLIDRYCGDTALIDNLRKVFRKTAQLTSKGLESPVSSAVVSTLTDVPPSQKQHAAVRMPQADLGSSLSDSSKPSEDVAQAHMASLKPAQSELSTSVVSHAPAETLDQDRIEDPPSALLAESEPLQPEVAQPEVAQPEAAQPAAAQPEVAQSEVAQPEVAQSEVAQSEVAQPEAAQPEVAKSEVSESDNLGKSLEPTEVVDPSAPPSEVPTALVQTSAVAVAISVSGDAEPVIAVDPKKKKKKKKKKKSVDDPFKDYNDFKQPINQLRNYQVLAINRGEKSGKLKIKIQADDQQLAAEAFKCLVPQNHPFQGFLEKCAKEALNKSLIPMVERELKRELTENAEKHATDVFAHNLRNLLLQPPMRDVRVLAIDPGFKRGCAVAVIGQRGDFLHQGEVTVVGNQTRRDESRQRLSSWIREFDIDVVAIGSGAACRQAEQLVSDCIQEFLTDHRVKYVMVNEAGASIYSTSEIGREEFPELSPAIRSAISIGRRLQEPLSELVKISPANLGVGMYQHDVRAKHLSETLDEVVQSCVNQVGVNVNTASVSLLKHVAGLNSLTAKRLVEYRQKINGFTNRQQFKEVAGIGDTTFVQAAGFLRIFEGGNPLDSTSIHPESYPVVVSVIQQIESTVDELFPRPTLPPIETALDSALDRASDGEAIAIVTVEESTSTESATPESATPESATPESATPESATPESVTPESVSPESVTPESVSPESVTPESVTPDSVTPESVTPESVSPESVTPESVTPESVTLESVTPESVSPELVSPELVSPELVSPEPASPESIPSQVLASEVAEVAGQLTRGTISQEQRNARGDAIKRLADLQISQLASDNDVGHLLVRDILQTLRRPDWDPRDRIARPIFRRGILKMDDLQPEMQLDGQVVNVVDFGVFVDIGLGDSSLVHVSRLAHHYIADPHRRFAIGDILKVWVEEVDSQRRRIKLTAIQPGSRPEGKRSAKRPSRKSQQSVPGGTSSSEERAKSSAVSKSDPQPGRDKGPTKPGRFGRQGGQQDNRNRHQQRSGGGNQRGSKKFVYRSKPEKVTPPITDGMLEGKEPMRSFSDLLQFVTKKPDAKDSSAQ